MPRKKRHGSVTEPDLDKFVTELAKNVTTYEMAIMEGICERIANGESLDKVCKGDGMPVRRTVFAWLNTIPECTMMYQNALAMRGEHYADQIVDMADSAIGQPGEIVSATKVAVDARKWVAARLLPKKYGDKLDVTAATTSINTNVNVGTYDTSKLSMDELAVVIANLTKALR